MSALDSMMGILPVVAVAGVATKMANSLFPTEKTSSSRKGSKSSKMYRAISRPMSKPGFGNFSNIGLQVELTGKEVLWYQRVLLQNRV